MSKNMSTAEQRLVRVHRFTSMQHTKLCVMFIEVKKEVEDQYTTFDCLRDPKKLEEQKALLYVYGSLRSHAVAEKVF
jgi:hypothetical protein